MPSDKETLAALVEAGERLAARERIERDSATETATIRRISAETEYWRRAKDARPALKRMLERLEKLEAVAEAAGKYRDACEDFEHMCERAVEEGWGDDPTGSTHVSSAADREQRSLAALAALLAKWNKETE